MKLTLTIPEVISLTGIGRTKIYELINSGEIPAKKIGIKTVVLKSDLDKFLNNLKHYPSSELME